MEHHKILPTMVRTNLFVLLWMIIFARVKSEDDQACNTPPDTAGSLCISECATCPAICSPPPPLINTKPPQPPPSPPSSPPPVQHPSPPQESYHSPPVHHPSPPEWYYFDSPPPLKTPPPPSSIVIVPNIQTPPGMGQDNFPKPYYYYYTSGASLPLKGSSIFVLFLAFHALYFYL